MNPHYLSKKSKLKNQKYDSSLMIHHFRLSKKSTISLFLSLCLLLSFLYISHFCFFYLSLSLSVTYIQNIFFPTIIPALDYPNQGRIQGGGVNRGTFPPEISIFEVLFLPVEGLFLFLKVFLILRGFFLFLEGLLIILGGLSR